MSLASSTTPGRFAELHEGFDERTDLAPGMDFRRPQFRREVFHRFYTHHLKYRSHPGCVYYLLDAIADELGLDTEQRLWLAFINGNTQNPVVSTIIIRRFPEPDMGSVDRLERWFGEHYSALPFDTDRRHHKKELIPATRSYLNLVNGDAAGYYAAAARDGFTGTWAAATAIHSFGRLSAFSYLEYCKLLGHGVDCNDLMLRDLPGSKSHRNGLARVLGRDDLDWHDKLSFDGDYTEQVMYWLEAEAGTLLEEALMRNAGWIDRGFPAAHVGNFTLESALCAFKQFFRGRRYPNIYQDMLVDRIHKAQALWPDEDLDLFWRSRARVLPTALRLEENPWDVGVKPLKQTWFREHGQLVSMDVDDPTFTNGYRAAATKH